MSERQPLPTHSIVLGAWRWRRHWQLRIASVALACACAWVAAAAPTGGAAGAAATPGQPPDYADPQSWLALPVHPSAAMRTPREAGMSDLQSLAVADVFYIHPTTSMRGDLRNAPIDDPEARRTAELMLMTQASAFNAVARIYAPRYRQITLPTYALGADALQEPAAIAYADVLAAFRYYIEHYNHGRPFFVLGHSQGTNHAQRLLSDAIQDSPLRGLLVAAYLPGQPIPRAVFAADLTRLAPCRRPAQTGCVAIWGTFGEGGGDDLAAWQHDNLYWDRALRLWADSRGMPLVNINPVSWDVRMRRTPPRLHRGAVPFGTDTTFGTVIPRLLAVRDAGNYVFVGPEPLSTRWFDDGGVFGGRNYHVFDVALFWLDLRENAHLRLNAWRRQHGAREPLLDTTATASAQVGRPWSYRIRASARADRYAVEGLPAGLALDARRGVISGTPTAVGVYALRLSARNAHGSTHAELALSVTAADAGDGR